MAYQIETPGDWPLGVYQIAVTDPVLGGSDGPPNLMGRALANRSVYQRLRNVTLWNADLAAAHGYPAKSCVMHGPSSWRALVDNTVEPGTDATKWERWAFSESELAAYLRDGLMAPTLCPDTGPVSPPYPAAPWTLWMSNKLEYWMWLGNTWGVVWNHWSDEFIQTSGTVPAGNTLHLQKQWTMHRAGKINAYTHLRMSTPASASGVVSSIGVQKNGAWVAAMPFENYAWTAAGAQYANTAAGIAIPVGAGDLIQIYFRSQNAVGTIISGQFRIEYCK